MLSANANYISAITTILHVGENCHVKQVNHSVKNNESFTVKFSHEEGIFARISYLEGRTSISINKMDADLTCNLLAGIDITKDGASQPHDVKIAFDQTRPLVFAYSFRTDVRLNGTYLAVLEEGTIKSGMISEGKHSPLTVEYVKLMTHTEYMADISFSLCGNYIYSVDRQVLRSPIQWPIPVKVLLPQGNPSPVGQKCQAIHPTVLEDNMFYIYNSYMWRIDRQINDGLVYLESKLVEDPASKSTRQMIGVLPDDFITGLGDNFFLVWPADSEKEVKMIVSTEGQSMLIMIKTGILARALADQSFPQHTL